ncbi:MAG TPA: RNA polymerase sigma factor [Tepidisphaeraceae bacterium]|jgi:RNA polymerase sigma-70 factor (ECF subfamily)
MLRELNQEAGVREVVLSEIEHDKLLHEATDAADEGEFEKLVAQHHESVQRLAFRLLGWRGDVEDVVQDVFLSALKQFGHFRGESSVLTWLTRITINRCRTYQRKQLLKLRWWKSLVAEQRAAEPASPPFSPDETSEQVRAAVRALPLNDREVIVLFYLEEQPSGEIAKLLNISVNAVDIRLHRARERLRLTLGNWVED